MELHRRAHKWAFPLGMLLVVLAVVGAVSLVRTAANGVRQQLNNPEERVFFETFLAKIIVHDPDPFDSPDSADDFSQLFDICLWSLTQDGNNTPQKFRQDKNDNLNLQIDKKTVDAEYMKLFNVSPPDYFTVEGNEFDFVWDAEHEYYLVPVTGTLPIYTPRVTDIKKTASQVRLTVDYIATNDFEVDAEWNITPAKPAKTMIITLYQRQDETYYVGAIQQQAGIDTVNNAPKISK
ncbi:MAG: hypothetical protein LBB50_02635 [Oscillospiraceae bacterium]|nr:hypothetical protein [Oscillospiraceae bacterium]